MERKVNIGNANLDFEINAVSQPDLTTAGAKTLVRTPGDLLVTYDFGGSGTPTLGLLRWLTTGAGNTAGQCFSANTLPCWGSRVNLTAAGDAEGAVNTAQIAEPFAGGNLGIGLFGEASIDLTAAGVFAGNVCQAFGSTFVRSRSSSSFTAEIKDFIAPVPVNISNCGSIKIVKHTDPRGQNQNFNYTSDLPAIAASTTTSAVAANGSFTLNDNGNTTGDSAGNTVLEPAVQQGTYHVTESGPADSYAFQSLGCTGGSTSVSGQSVTITLAPNDVVTCTYVNKLNSASLGTLVSATNPVFPGSAVHDTAMVTGNNAAATPTGTVTFFLCGPTQSDAGCTSGGTNIGTGSLSGTGATASATSPDVNTAASSLSAGHYCFRAEWPGDNHYPGALAENGGASGTNECFTVRTIPTTVTTTPSAGSGGTANFGSSVTDHAVVAATQTGDGTPTGTVTFFVCNPTQLTGGACPSGGTQVGSPVTTQAVSGSSPPASFADSDAITANQTGKWCFRAVYTPGGANGSNYTGNSDASTGECFTVTDTTASTSAQTWRPNDSATATAGHAAPLNGTLSADLYTGSTCGVSSGGAVSGQHYEKSLTNATTLADRTLTTNNTSFNVSSTASVSWLVTFSSTDANVSGSSHCEVTSLTITN